MSETHRVGQRLSFDGAACTVRYVGDVAGTSGTWLGVEWDDQARGKHDGSHKGTRYFKCVSKSLTAASFVRPTRKADSPQSFVAALNEKYAGTGQSRADSQIRFSGKIAQEVGFDKIRRQLARVQDLKVIILDGMCINGARNVDSDNSIRETCPSVTQLDMSRNLFERIAPVVEISRELDSLRKLTLSGNRFQDVLNDSSLADCRDSIQDVIELALEDNLLSWDELCYVATRCTALKSLSVGANQLTSLPTLDYANLTSTLTNLNLEYNEITSFSDLSSLTALKALQSLHLKGNSISQWASPRTSAPTFPSSVQYVDLSYNNIEDWYFVDQFKEYFPGLTGLRLAHNPVYQLREDSDNKVSSSEDAHMFTIARIASLKTLNFTTVSPSDRGNAEMFYLSRIAKQLAAVPESAEDSVKAQHPRYAELCDTYGEPDVIRREEVNPAFLEARLVTVSFHLEGEGKKTTRIPKSFDVYAVKGIAGKLFGLSPLGLRLIWETGEWDPVAKFYDSDEDTSDEEDLEVEEVPQRQKTEDSTIAEEAKAGGRWVKREVELRDGPRQLGYCVDGLDASIRVEER